MTGYWALDDGQSLCYIDSGDISNRTQNVPQAIAAVNIQDLSSLELLSPADTRYDFTLTEPHSTHSNHRVHANSGPCLRSGDLAFTTSQSGGNAGTELTSIDGFNDPVSQSAFNDATCPGHSAKPSSFSGSKGSTRKRSFEASHRQPTDVIELESRKRPQSQKQTLLRPAVTYNMTDQCLLSPLANLNLTMGFNTRLPNSRFDGYIHALRQLIRCSAERSSLGNNLKRALTAEGVLWVVRESWPAAEGYWNLTATFKGFLHAELWRNFPCERTYRQLPPEYRPTRAQLMVPHSPMIDWMPWPDLRDLAIRYQDEIDTDELFRMAILNVVAHRKRLTGFSPTKSNSLPDKKSFRVWDLVCLEKLNGVNPLADPGLTRKPVLHSPSARALVRAFDLEYDEFATQKLDDCFFEAFPSLYCDTAASGWTVEAFPTISPEDVGYPINLTGSAVHRLKSRFESLIGSVIEV